MQRNILLGWKLARLACLPSYLLARALASQGVLPPGLLLQPLFTHSGSSLSLEELVILPSKDSQEMSPDEQLASILGQWDVLVMTVNKLNEAIGLL